MPTHFEKLTLGRDTFAYRTAGAGPDLLLLHGWQSSGRMWEGTMEFLAPHYRLWAPDLMGFGDSRNHDPHQNISVDDQMRLVAAFCKAAGIRPEVIIGHSMGGCVALKLALDYPDLMDKLVLISPLVTGKIGGNLDQLLATGFGRAVLLNIGQHLWPQLPRVRGRLSFFVAAGQPPEAAKRTVDDFQKGTWGAFYGGLMSLIKVRLEERLPELKKPTLVITGGRDMTVPPSDGRLIAQTVPGTRYLEFAQCRHHVPDEDPLAFQSALAEFLGLQTQEAPSTSYAISAA